MTSVRWIKVIMISVLMMMMIIVKVEADPSSPRYGHGAVLINKKIYIYGGRKVTSTIDPYEIDNLNIINEFIILDVSKSFNTNNPSWEINNIGTNPNLFHHGVTSGGDDLMIIFGGISDTTSNNSILWYCHTDSSKIFQPSNVNTDISSSKRFSFGMVSDEDNTYIIGGADPISLSTITATEGIISIGINSIGSSIAISSFISANVASYDHTATLLNGTIYVIGGYNTGSYVNMSSIRIYNIKDHAWDTKTAKGSLPDVRRAHRAVGYNNAIIIHGGFNENGDTNNLFKLEVSSLTWEKLDISGQDPGARYSHTFTLVGDYIIGTYGLSKTNGSSSNIFILDLKNSSWTKEFNPSSVTTTTTSTTSKTTISTRPTPTNSSLPSQQQTSNIVPVIIIASIGKRSSSTPSSPPPPSSSRNNNFHVSSSLPIFNFNIPVIIIASIGKRSSSTPSSPPPPSSSRNNNFHVSSSLPIFNFNSRTETVTIPSSSEKDPDWDQLVLVLDQRQE
ncbi:hypothetical protein Glove_86g143 [Diversispora epigaea]|uniref:Galactose oxidase n=1 Tax=Diversispora epigaea TaxID=1348612 RepID=A0A397JH27_9GLOM|nr:hypothetical protein Glove_86g143 [Diversispora epigaea]